MTEHAHADAATADVTGGLLVVRGAGLGALYGGLFGMFIGPVTDLVTFRGDPFDPAIFILAVYTGPVGLIYGLLAGLAVGLVVALLPAWRRTATSARWVAATVGPLAVALISWALFRPSLHIGANQTTEHVVETMVLAFGYPCVSALLVGALGGSKLVAPARQDATPSWQTKPAL